jgi:hypothetical protein
MKLTGRLAASRSGLLLASCVAATSALARTTTVLRHPVSPGYDDLLTALAAWLLVGCAAWSMLICVAALVETATAGRFRATAWVGCPPSLRRLLVTGIGVALVSGVPGQSALDAVNVESPTVTSTRGPATSWQRSLPVPARPLGQVHAQAPPRVVVQPGDTLWQLATNRLRPSPAGGEVAELVERFHRRNRELIGPDPDLIRPGQRLVVPALPRPAQTRHLEEKS